MHLVDVTIVAVYLLGMMLAGVVPGRSVRASA